MKTNFDLDDFMTDEVIFPTNAESPQTAGEMGSRAATKYLNAHPHHFPELGEPTLRSTFTGIALLALGAGFLAGRFVKR